MTGTIHEGDPEVRNVTKVRTLDTNAQEVEFNLLARIENISDWHKAKRGVAACLKLKRRLKEGVKQKTREYATPSVSELQEAEEIILKDVQKQALQKS